MTDVLVGYRVRSRADDGDAAGEDENGEQVRLVRIPSGDAAAEAALEAWLPAEGPHLQRLLDLGCAPNGDLVAVLADVPIALVDLIASAPLEVAEAVTVLIPIAEALAALHTAGVAHGSVGAAAIGLTDGGVPVLLMPRTARRAGGGDGDPRDADRRALAVLARRLLPAPVPEGLLTALEQDPGGAGVEALFLLTEPRPVLLSRTAGGLESARGTPARLVAPALPEPEPRSTRPHRVPPVLATVAARLGTAARGVRARVWLAAAVSLVSLATALLLLRGHGVTAQAAAPSVPAGTPSAATAPVTVRSPSVSPLPPPAAPPAPGSMRSVAAVTALLAARARCLAAGSTACLDAIDAPGSPVEAADRLSLSAGVDAVLPPNVDPVLLRESGATAVLAVGSHTVLAIREPGGWRLRDVIAPGPAAAQMPSEPSKSPSSSRSRTVERNRAASAPSTMRWS